MNVTPNETGILLKLFKDHITNKIVEHTMTAVRREVEYLAREAVKDM